MHSQIKYEFKYLLISVPGFYAKKTKDSAQSSSSEPPVKSFPVEEAVSLDPPLIQPPILEIPTIKVIQKYPSFFKNQLSLMLL